MNRPEILAPVGTWEMCLAAVHNGADAVYMGMPGFNARGRAKTFSLEELKEMIEYCHLYGAKVLLAFNVLIFERELADAAKLLEEVLPLRPDALIVQDLGLVRLIKKMAPEQTVHASTQMTISNPESIEFVSELGMKRYVLARELSLTEISRIREKTKAELEVFVHGALCVAYSGQCLTSESQGGRSANRGQCAQACRLPYELIVDGTKKELGSRSYLLSPKDLCGLGEVPELQKIGINSFKIEGRLKAPEYVAATVKRYRQKRDNERMEEDSAIHEMKITYSRDYFSGWLHGVDHQQLVDARYSDHHGAKVGEISAIKERTVIINSAVKLSAGDGIVCVDFERSRDCGGKIFSVKKVGKEYEVKFLPDFPLQKLRQGMTVFVNGSDTILKELRQSFEAREQLKRIDILLEVSGSAGEPLLVVVKDDIGNEITVKSEVALETATKAPINKAFIADELSALGQTPFKVKSCNITLNGELFLHHRALKDLRREYVAQLTKRRMYRDSIAIYSAKDSIGQLSVESKSVAQATPPKLSVLIRQAEQIEALRDLPIECVYLDYEFGKDYEDSATLLRKLGLKFGITTTRILKPGELAHLKVIDRLKPDTVLVRNLGALQFFKDKGLTLIGDFSLNVSNSLTASWLSSKGLARLTPSYDLNKEQLLEFCEAAHGIPLEVTIHQYMPTFHMEHCVFAAFLSNGSSYRDCGRPCEKHRVELKDPQGVLHPLKPDAECRNTVYQGKPQSASKLVPNLLERGVVHFRLEALFETPSELRAKILAYLDLLNGNCSAEGLYQRLGVVERYGVTEGQLYNIRVWKDRKQELSR